MPGELRVDTAPLASGGQGLLSAAGDIPLPQVPCTAAGGDALSTILNARTQAIEAPLIAGMPVTKAEALRTAQNIMQAAGIYERVDRQVADQILKVLFGIDGTEGAGADGSGGGGGGGAAGGSDGPDDGHADADGIASCPDTKAIGGHGGVDSTGNHAGSPERDAAGRPNGRRRRRKGSGVGSTGRGVAGRGEARRISRRGTGGEGSAVDSFRRCCGAEQRGTGTGDPAAGAGCSAAAAQAGADAPCDVRTGKRSVT